MTDRDRDLVQCRGTTPLGCANWMDGRGSRCASCIRRAERLVERLKRERPGREQT